MSTVQTPVDDYFPRDRQVARLRVPPHSIEAESSVLGGLLLDNAAWDRVGDLLTDSDFYGYTHRLIFVAIGQLVNATKPADVMTVYDQLQKIGKGEEVGGLAYLNSLAQYVPSAGNIRRYAEIVRERSVLRKLVSASDEIATAAFNPQGRSVDAILDAAQKLLVEVSPEANTEEWVGMDRLVVEQLNHIQDLADNPDNNGNAIPTGFEDMDDLMDGGMRAGQFIVIGARPSMGKSSIADAIGEHVALHEGLPVAKFSMEMENSEGAQRSIARIGSIPLHVLRRPHKMGDTDWQNLTLAIEKLRNVQFYSNDRGGLNINQIRTKARALHRKVGGLGLVIVDYFQLMSGTDPRVKRNEQLDEASRGLKALAKELRCPVIALAQINRSVESEGTSWEAQMPRFKDLKDCGSLEQDADVILFLIRPSIAQQGLAEEWKHYARGHLAKQRGGRTGMLHFQWLGQYTRYSCWPADREMPSSKVVTKGGKAL